jgi:hypothetical protein
MNYVRIYQKYRFRFLVCFNNSFLYENNKEIKMGTNYYHRTNCCDKCDRFDERHIGKSSAGWQFNFQGYEDIKSYEAWLRLLWKSTKIDKTGKIFDEYGKEIDLDDFVRMVSNKQKEPNNHYDHCENEGHSMDNDWKDGEGYAFTSSEFS